MVQVLDLIRSTCGSSCDSVATCWHYKLKVRRPESACGPQAQSDSRSTINLDLLGSPNVIKANNPEVKVDLGEEQCMLVCDLEIDSLEPRDQWNVTWYKMRPNGAWDENVILKNVQYVLSDDDLVLTIRNVTFENRGIYRCEIINTEERFATCVAEFNVIVIPKDSSDGVVRIRIDQTPICSKVGDRINMVAVIENRPKKMKVDWYKMKGYEETPISRRKCKVTNSRVHSQLKLRSVTTDDGGVYRIKITSPDYVAVGHIILNVNEQNCEVEIGEMMARRFEMLDSEGTGYLPPSQVRETMADLGLTSPRGNIDEVIYNCVDSTGTKVEYSKFIEDIIHQYKSEFSL